MKIINRGLTVDIVTNEIEVIDRMLIMFHKAMDNATNPQFKELWSKKYEKAKDYKTKHLLS